MTFFFVYFDTSGTLGVETEKDNSVSSASRRWNLPHRHRTPEPLSYGALRPTVGSVEGPYVGHGRLCPWVSDSETRHSVFDLLPGFLSLYSRLVHPLHAGPSFTLVWVLPVFYHDVFRKEKKNDVTKVSIRVSVTVYLCILRNLRYT